MGGNFDHEQVELPNLGPGYVENAFSLGQNGGFIVAIRIMSVKNYFEICRHKGVCYNGSGDIMGKGLHN